MFTAMLAHELKNPLASISFSVDSFASKKQMIKHHKLIELKRPFTT